MCVFEAVLATPTMGSNKTSFQAVRSVERLLQGPPGQLSLFAGDPHVIGRPCCPMRVVLRGTTDPRTRSPERAIEMQACGGLGKSVVPSHHRITASG